MPVYYDGIKIIQHRIDRLVDKVVVVEVKSTSTLCEADHRKLLNYLRGTDLNVGLLLHFGPKPKVFRKIATDEFKI